MRKKSILRRFFSTFPTIWSDSSCLITLNLALKKPPSRQNNPNYVLKKTRNSSILVLTQQGATMSKYTQLNEKYWRHCIKVSGKTQTRKRIQGIIRKASGRRRDELIIIYLEVFGAQV